MDHPLDQYLAPGDAPDAQELPVAQEMDIEPEMLEEEALVSCNCSTSSPRCSQHNDLQADQIPDPGCLADADDAEEPAFAVAQPADHNLEEPEDYIDPETVSLEDIKTTLKFIDLVRHATLDNGELDPDTIDRLRNPLQHPPDVDDPDLILALDIFLSTTSAAEDTYTSVMKAISRRFPETETLSHYQVKQRIEQLTGISPITHDMCVNSCAGFTGPFKDLMNCPICNDFRYEAHPYHESHGEKKIPRKTFSTLPIGPQLQALWRHPDTAGAMRYRARRSQEILNQRNAEGHIDIEAYDDFLCGSEYLDAFENGRINDHDTTLLLSIDGAQLYEKKISDCWIYIWVILDFHPELRYKTHIVLFGGIFPGPRKPKHFISLLYPGIHHLSALQREGFRVWDAYDGQVHISRPFFNFGTADGLGVVYMNGLTGHVGYYSCRHYCPVKGRRVAGEKRYYPVHLKPLDYTVEDCDHDNYNFARLPVRPAHEYSNNVARVAAATTIGEYNDLRKDTGIVAPSLFSGLDPDHMLRIPGCFAGDLMHLIALNITQLFLILWRGTMKCKAPDNKATWGWAVLVGDVWERHGKTVADATPYIPGSFDVPPRNPAEKISSGYKAKEYLTYVFLLGPALLYNILPQPYWRHFCKLVYAVRILHQHRIPKDDVIEAHNLLLEFVREYEELYYQRKIERLHFCRPSIHTLLHLAREVIRLGPGCYYTQWTMERTIGNITEEIKQPSKPYANLAQRAVRRNQVNALKAMIPALDPQENEPRGSEEVADGYTLLRARDENMQKIGGPNGAAIRHYMQQELEDVRDNWTPRVRRWARLRLPTGQIARSAWKEKAKPLEKVRISRNVKVHVYH
jgi:hypothetical protein